MKPKISGWHCLVYKKWTSGTYLVLICIVLCIQTSSVSADSLRTIAGAGTSLCSTFLRELVESPQTTAWTYLSWAQGYLSAVNLQRSRLREVAVDMLPSDFDLTKQVIFLQTYCRSFPDRHFDQAATGMYFELLAHHTTISSKPLD